MIFNLFKNKSSDKNKSTDNLFNEVTHSHKNIYI